MNRIDRISAILIHLQSKRIVKGQEIADRFDISLRTVYRDIKSLEQAGVPILSEAGAGYSLMDGYRLPPVMFTKDEALAFITAEKLIEKLTDSATLKIYQSALFKIKSVLRNEEKDHVETMSDYIEVRKFYAHNSTISENHLQPILHCIAQKKILELHYFANHSQQESIRKVEPVGIYLMSNQWYLIAFCLLRNDYRTFRLDRMTKIKNSEQFFKTKHPPIKTYLKQLVRDQNEMHEIVIRGPKGLMKYIGEQKYYNGFVGERLIDDDVELSFLTCSIEGFARWFLMFGDHAYIVKPNALKVKLNALIEKMLQGINS